MKKFLTFVFLVVFLGSLGKIAMLALDYSREQEIYEETAGKYTTVVENTVSDASREGHTDAEKEAAPDGDKADSYKDENRIYENPPISVDFEALKAVNEEVVGWLYCENSRINYPLVHSTDNDYYLTHTYDGKEAKAGAIFVDARNSHDFEDANTIIYGHYIKDGSMFASLKKWANQKFYDEHKVMWLLTPAKNYKIHLFSGFITSALSDDFEIHDEAGEAFDEYLKNAVSKSDFLANVDLKSDAHYVVFSTCNYSFENARYVLYGMLEPMD